MSAYMILALVGEAEPFVNEVTEGLNEVCPVSVQHTGDDADE